MRSIYSACALEGSSFLSKCVHGVLIIWHVCIYSHCLLFFSMLFVLSKMFMQFEQIHPPANSSLPPWPSPQFALSKSYAYLQRKQWKLQAFKSKTMPVVKVSQWVCQWEIWSKPHLPQWDTEVLHCCLFLELRVSQWHTWDRKQTPDCGLCTQWAQRTPGLSLRSTNKVILSGKKSRSNYIKSTFYRFIVIQ